jgi:hypothetical protein
MVDMHTQYPQIEEDNELLIVLSAKRFSSVATILPELKPWQGVLPSGLQIFPYHMGNMHNLASMIWEDTTLQTLLAVMQTLNRNSAVWKLDRGACLDHWNKWFWSSRIFENFHTCRIDYKEHFVIWMCGLCRFQLILKNCWPSLMIHTTQNLDNFEFELRLWNSTILRVS